MTSRWKRTTQAFLLCVVVLTELIPAFSRSAVTIVAVLSRDVAPYRQALRGFEEVLESSGKEHQIYELVIDGLKLDEAGLAARIRAQNPDLVLTIGSAATQSVTSRINDIPVVFSLVLPGAGLDSLQDLRDERANVTGSSMEIPYRTQFTKMREVLPGLQKIGVLYDPAVTGPIVEGAAGAAREMGLDLVALPVTSEKDVLEGTEALARQVDVLWSVADSTVFSPQGLKQILLVTLRNRVPFVGLSPSFVKAGALLALSVDYQDVGRQSGEAALKVLGGEQPSRIPMTVPRSVSLSLNMNTARQIRVQIQDQIRSKAELFF